jgi:uncharacterized protein (TIGR02466 family)
MPDGDLDPVTDLAKNGQIEHVFSTPIFSHVLRDADNLNSKLRELILEMEQRVAGVNRSNQGGWQSDPDFFRLDSPSVATLERYLHRAIKVATLRATSQPNLKFHTELYGWAAVNRKGHYNATHVHPMATWSGVFYVDPGDELPGTAGGLLEFLHPVAASVMTFFPGVLPSARVVQPKGGMLILFPSYLQHNVRPYSGERPRVCIPFNAHLKRATDP